MNTVNVGLDFSPYLINRGGQQMDGAFSGQAFRNKYLADLDDAARWHDSELCVVLDFGEVKRLGPSWANEVFAFFTKYGKPGIILKKIKLVNISKVKRDIIQVEIDTGYYAK